jgi:nucleoside-diphosphate-sugar epimerase
MKIFITGKNGFIAQTLIIRLLEDNHIIETSSQGDDLKLKLEEFQPDIIYHLAAETITNDKMVESNILLTHIILEYCRHNPIKKLLVFGSSSEYGRKTVPIKETDLLEPQTMYEGTKACATLLSRCYAYTYNIPTTVIRPMSVYGPLEKPNKFMTLLFSKKLKYLNEAYHDWIYIDDFIEGTLTVMNYEEVEIFNIVNIGYGKQYSNTFIMKEVEKLMDYKFNCVIDEIKGKVYDSMSWVCDPTLLNNKYKFFPKYTIQEGLAAHYHIFKNSLISEHTLSTSSTDIP